MNVVDANVVVDVLMRRRSLTVRDLHAPEVLVPEVLHALRKLLRLGAIGEDTADAAVAWLAGAAITFWPHAPLAPAVWALRDELSAYDATYLALTRSLPGAELLTADAGLASVAERRLGADRVRLLT